MTEPASQFDPSRPLPTRHKRAVSSNQAGAGNLSGQPGPANPPVRWLRRPAPGSPQGAWPAIDRIHRWHRARLWRRRWIVALLVTVVLVLLGVGVATYLSPNPSSTISKTPESEAASGKEADDASPQADSGSPKPKGSGSQAADGPGADDEPSDIEDGNAETGPARPELSALRQMVLPALVTVSRGRGRGTGFLIEGGLVVTAYHVLPLGEKATVVFQDGERAGVVGHVTFDTVTDLAVLRTDTKKTRQPLKLAASLPATGAKVAAFKPGGGELQGTVMGIGKSEIPGEGAGREILRTTLNAVPGWSGGPVVNMKGEVVGVNKRLDGSSFDSQELKIATGSAAVPVTLLNQLLAIVKLTEEIQSDPKNAALRRDRAARYMSKGEFKEAIDDYTELIRLEPEDAEAYFSRGKAYAERSEFGQALADYTKAITLNADFIEAYRGRAAVYERKGDLGGVIADYGELIRLLPKAEADALQPKLAEIYRNHAKKCAESGDVDKALADLSALIGLRPKDVEARAERARIYDAKGDSEQAIADYTAAIRLQPKKTDLYRRRDIARAAKGEHEAAIVDFTEVIRLDPKDAEAYCSRGAVHGSRHNFKKAIADFTEAIRLDKWLAKAYFDRGSAYKALGNEVKAKADFDQALKLGYRPR